MAKPEWGTKRTCTSCDAKFYDMTKRPVVCPKCGTELAVDKPVRSRRPEPAKPTPRPAKTEDPEAEDDDDDLLADDDLDEDDIDNDTDDLDDEV